MQAWVSGFLTSFTEYHGMRLLTGFFAAFFLLSCGLSVDTRVADHPVTRMAIVHSIKLGQTTPAQLIAQWGHPFQKSREGGRVDYVYRAHGPGDGGFVIVTFEYNLAINVRSNETQGCRARFSPRVPGYDWATLRVVKPMELCAHSVTENGVIPEVTNDRYVPLTGSAK